MVNFPATFFKNLESIPDFNKDAFIKVHANPLPITSIRINPVKIIKSQLSHLPIANAVPWNPYGYYLSDRPSFTLDPYFHAGTYYVQEASSMFIAHIVNHIKRNDNKKEWKILDACAAPGGKTTLLGDVFSTSFVVANEVIASRNNILVDNIIKWGNPYIMVTQNDPTHFSKIPNFFNLILIDAPCSGSGLFRKDPEAIQEWSLNNVQLCSQRQQRIIHNLLPALEEDGYLIYSTCSFSMEENEHIIDEFIRKHSLETIRIPLQENWDIEEVYTSQKAYGYRFWPYKLKGEGFFVACLKKKKSTTKIFLQKIKASKNKTDFSFAIDKWFKPIEEIYYHSHKENIYAIPKSIAEDFLILSKQLYIKRAGIHLGKIIRDDLIPEHDLAMSGLATEEVVRINVEYDTAISFLRKENININTQHKGWAIICYDGLPLGWVKMLSNRINNYYPSSLKILSPYNPKC